MERYVKANVSEKTIFYLYETPEGLKEVESKEEAREGWRYAGRRQEIMLRTYKLPLDRYLKACMEFEEG